MEYLSVALVTLVSFALLIAWSCAVAGDELSPLEACVFPALGVAGAWALAVWVAGSLGWLSSASVLILLFGLLLAGAAWSTRGRGPQVLAVRLRERVGSLAQSLRNLRRGEQVALAFLSFQCALLFVLTLAPPSAGDYDSLMYHLAAPLRYVRAGRVLELGYDHHTYFPFTFEMLFAAPLAVWSDPLKGAVAAKLLHWATLPASIALLLAAGARWKSQLAGWIAALAWASIPVVAAEATTAYIDVGLAAFVLAAFLAFSTMLYDTGQSTQSARSWMWWSAAMAGFALGSKYLGALFVGILGAWWLGSLLLSRGKTSTSAAPRWLVAWSIGVLLLGGGWYARNQAWVGSPVFPFAYAIFGGENWSPERAAAYEVDQKKFGFGRAPSDWLLLPFRLTFSPFNAAARADNSTVGLPAWPLSSQPANDTFHSGLFEVTGFATQTMIGPLLLALGLPALAVRRKPPAVGMWAWSVGFLWIFWGATGQYARYLLPALALWCGVCGWGSARLWQFSITRAAIALALVVWLPASLLLAWRNTSHAWPVASGQSSGREWLNRAFLGFEAMEWASQNTPATSNFAVFGEPRCFYLERPYFWADVEHNTLLKPGELTQENALDSLKRLGATHVLWNAGPTSVFGPPEPVRLALQERGALIHEAKGYRIYRLP